MNFPKELSYTKTHEWVRFLDETTARVGLSDYAQSTMGDLVFVNLPALGDAILPEQAICDVESVKAVSDVYAPLKGTVRAVNEALLDAPQLINECPYDAWMYEVADVTDRVEFLSAEEYEAFLATQE